MSYAIMRFEKVKIESLPNKDRHHSKREKLKHREHPECEKFNKTFRRNDETLLKNVKRIIKEQEERTRKKVRKDANVVVEFVFTFSPEAEDTFDIWEWDRQNRKFLFNMFGKENILRYDLEFDEKTPHVHAFVCPRNKEGNICFKSYVSNKHDIEDMQTDYAKLMEPFGLERGKSKDVTKAFHKSLREYYNEKQAEADVIVSEAEKQANQIIEEAQKKRKKYLKECEEIANSVLDDFVL